MAPNAESTNNDDLDNLVDNLSSLAIERPTPATPVTWLEETGFDAAELSPVYLLSFLSTNDLYFQTRTDFLLFLEELEEAVHDFEPIPTSHHHLLMMIILRRLEVRELSPSKYVLSNLSSIFDVASKVLTYFIQDKKLALLMIGENPSLSSAVSTIAVRGAITNVRATCWRRESKGVRQAIADHANVMDEGARRDRYVSILNSREDFRSFDQFILSPLARNFDATKIESYKSLNHPYDIIFGHCLYPHFKPNTKADPFGLLLGVLAAVKQDIDRRKDQKPALVILTIPDNQWKEGYCMPSVIQRTRIDFQYLGANRVLEEQLLEYEYLHEHSDGRGKKLNGLHWSIAPNLLAHVFVSRGKGKEAEEVEEAESSEDDE